MIYSCNKTNDMHQYLKFIFVLGLYVFRTVSLSIIRSLALNTQRYIQVIIIIIIIIIFTAIGLLPGGSGYFTCKQNMKLVTTKFN